METVKKVLISLLEMKAILMPILIPVVLIPILLYVEGDVGRCAYAISILILLWVGEIFPLPVTSLLPVVLFPTLGVLTAGQVASEYIKNSSILVIGIFGIVAGVERWGLHRRIALAILIFFGTKPHWLIFGMLITTTVLSVFVTAGVAVLMLPIVRGIVDKLQNVDMINDTKLDDDEDDERSEDDQKNSENPQHQEEIARLFKALSLCVAYGVTLGSSAVLTGGPSNLIAVTVTNEFYQKYDVSSKLTFIGWFVFGAPIAVIVVILNWIWFVIYFLHGKGLFRRATITEEMAKAEKRVKQHLKEEYQSLGPWKYPEVVVLVFLILLMVLFLTEDLYFAPGWKSVFKKGYVGSPVISTVLLVLLFMIPAKSPKELICGRNQDSSGSKFAPILTWADVNRTCPWGMILLFGAAFAIVKACQESGLNAVIQDQFETFANLEPWMLTLTVTTLTTFLTEFISNSAAVTMLLPILGNVAILANLDPLALLLPVTLATKFAFMMPIATVPNAVVYSLGALNVKDMAVAGFLMNIITLIILNIGAHTWGKAYFRWDVIPDEMKLNFTTAGGQVI